MASPGTSKRGSLLDSDTNTGFSKGANQGSSDSGSNANKIKIGVIIACFAGAGIAYYTINSSSGPAKTPEVRQAEQRAEQIQQQMEATQPKTTEPEPPPPTDPGPNRLRKAPGT